MNCLLVIAHPLADSLCASLAAQAAQQLRDQGHTVETLDLYAEGFAPALTAAERAGYYAERAELSAVMPQIAQLQRAQALVLCFPTWWFSMPAMLKGWFDRVWAPGVAYAHARDLGAIRPLLGELRHVLAITTLGSAAWVDHLVMRRPVRRVLKTALVGSCAPQAHFEMLSLYRSEQLSDARVQAFARQMRARLQAWR
jgi:NAD(P)H dehydrogenase (quinone)